MNADRRRRKSISSLLPIDEKNGGNGNGGVWRNEEAALGIEIVVVVVVGRMEMGKKGPILPLLLLRKCLGVRARESTL